LPENFLILFNPKNQVAYTKDIERCFCGKAPTLARLDVSFGEQISVEWLKIQLFDLFEFSGAKKEGTPEEYANFLQRISTDISAQFSFLKVTEFMYFFQQFKSGKYGKFYGSIDALTVTVALQDFLQEHKKYVEIEFKRQEEDKRKRKEYLTKSLWELSGELVQSSDKSQGEMYCYLFFNDLIYNGLRD
jgi:hypothetical protein